MSIVFNKPKSTFNSESVVQMITAIITVSVFIASFTGLTFAQTDENSAAINKMIEEYQRVWDTHEASSVAGFFTKDADFVMGNLPAAHGREAIEDWWRNYFTRQEPERRLTIVVNSVRLIASDVVLANIETITGGSDSKGVELRKRKARGTWVLHQQDSSWLISTIRGMPTEEDSVLLVGSMATARSLRPDIREFIDAFEDAWNSHNASAVSAFFRNDADIIIRNKPLIQGIQAIQNWWHDYFSAPRSYRAILIIDEIRTVSDDVVQVNVIGTGAVPEAKDKLQPVRQTNAMWILVHKDGKWLIAALRVLPGKDDRIIRESDN
jgi:uncharacterized protein (TIGR02246 family)